MKKYKKVFIIIILLIIILFTILRIKDYIILYRITKVTESFRDSLEPYFQKITDISSDYTRVSESYRNSNTLVSKDTISKKDNTILTTISWWSLDEKICNAYLADYEKNAEGIENKKLICMTTNKDHIKEALNGDYYANHGGYSLNELEIEYSEIWLNIRNKIEDLFFYPSVSSCKYKEKECYVFYPYGRNACMKTYVDKDTLLTIATEYWNNTNDDFYTMEYEYLTEVPEGIFEKPNPKDFDEVIFIDSANDNIDTIRKKVKVAKNPITGTNLKAGEQLVENVELKENEELNFLNLTPNETGVIKFEIYNLETYNKFREKYTRLRELREEDFDAYYVVIAYKIGEKLNYLEQYESQEAWKFNFVVNGEKTNKESILLAVIPNETGNRSTEFVESDEKLKIDAKIAMDTANKFLTEIGEYLDIRFDSYIGYSDDHLDLLTIEEFSKLEYIKTPIAGKERICWNLHYRVVDHETINYIEVYIDAITGELIGAKKFYK